MKVKLIKTEEEYLQAVAYLEEIGDREDFQDNEDLIEEFELIAALVEIYDKQHFPVQAGDPIEIIKLKMEYMGIKRKDLAHIASSGVLSEVFNKKRALSKQMIREFSILLGINQNLLNQPYFLNDNIVVKPKTIVQGSVVQPPSTFKFIKKTRSAVDVFKKRVYVNCMLLNVACPS